ncbi:MAG: hypothetical protein A2V81_01915 [Candidatus Abawacabacteria bacterium RBG_16_42_10]|uniref:Calcineurin-like phosphoesterase domain-containing protein n=1 Tax=Candidatus Abawacabacteria bacterium RBG_16_42_10 TaxID=1817814 RepID=A0A1F4XKN5_9BACT|nr:MAG: hypothetical protein A2V81_01915 [Candidatus Abawacabacteria bacterium RBG_16_42_10]
MLSHEGGRLRRPQAPTGTLRGREGGDNEKTFKKFVSFVEVWPRIIIFQTIITFVIGYIWTFIFGLNLSSFFSLGFVLFVLIFISIKQNWWLLIFGLAFVCPWLYLVYFPIHWYIISPQVLTLTYLIIGISIFLYGHLIEPHWIRVKQLSVPSTKFPDTLVFISDTQSDSFGYREKKTIDIIKNIKPKIIFHSGDIYNGTATSNSKASKAAYRLLKEISAIAPVYIVPGDHPMSIDEVKALLKPLTNVTFLNNQKAKHILNKTSYEIIGLNRYAPETSLLASKTDCDYRIVLSHTPSPWIQAKHYPFDLMFCGHTHGGQLCLPFFGAFTSGTMLPRKFAYGLFQSQTATMYVTSGIGLEGLIAPKIRLFCRPEIIIIKGQK